MKKSYVVCSSVLLDDPHCVKTLINGNENDIYILPHVLDTLKSLKSDNRVSHIVNEVTDELIQNSDHINILYSDQKNILDQLLEFRDLKKHEGDLIFVTNNKILALQTQKFGIKTQEFRDSNPYQSESQKYTGFIDINTENYIPNCFFWREGKLYYNNLNKEKLIDYENSIWNIKPKTIYQNAAMELLLNENLDLVTIQSQAGFGKTFISLASALYWTLEKKRFKKIYIFKHNIDVGQERLGFLPGSVDEKTQPYFRPIYDLLMKLHDIRPANRLFEDIKSPSLTIDKKVLEFLPLNFIRGMNIDNSYVIIDETQNFSRQEMRVILSRMGENTRCVCLGDVDQIDNSFLNKSNNGLNWIVKLATGKSNYGHIILKGKNSRGPIADLAREIGI
jgi:PhoH-like ATPase